MDAELLGGAEITGILTEAGSRAALANVEVALLRPIVKGVLRSVRTDAAGRYSFRGLASGIYVVGFSYTSTGSDDLDCYPTGYYKGATEFDAAFPLTVTAPSVLAGADEELKNVCPPEARPRVVQVSFLPAPYPPAAKRKKCRKGFHKQRAKGKVRCVKKPRKHHRRKGGRGPPAVATDR